MKLFDRLILLYDGLTKPRCEDVDSRSSMMMMMMLGPVADAGAKPAIMPA